MARAIALLLCLAATAWSGGPTKKGPFKKIAVIQLREKSGVPIDDSVKVSVIRRLEMAKNWGADCVILDIESYGGYLGSSLETGDEVFDFGRNIHTIAYVGRKAISGAAMMAVSCREIVISEVATIGDSQVVGGPTGEKMPEKAQTIAAAVFRKFAEGNGYPVPLLESMVRQEMEVTRYKKPNDPTDSSKGFTWVYYRTDTVVDGPKQRDFEEHRLYDEEIVVRANELPTLTSREAIEFGLASRLEPNLEALIASLSDENTSVTHLEWTWAEQTSRWLLSMRVWLFLIGAGALYFALKMPGTGVPEALALICFGLFFSASAVAGFAGALEVVLFFIGLLLLVVEIFILPGFGIPGFLGLACLLGSIALAAIPDGGLPTDMGPGGYLLPVAQDFLIGAIGGFILVIFIARNLPHVPYFNRLALGTPDRTVQATPLATEAERHPMIDMTGVADSDLRPAGRAVIGGEQRDVVCESGYVTAGTPVRVIGVKGNVITVRAEQE